MKFTFGARLTEVSICCQDKRIKTLNWYSDYKVILGNIGEINQPPYSKHDENWKK